VGRPPTGFSGAPNLPVIMQFLRSVYLR